MYTMKGAAWAGDTMLTLRPFKEKKEMQNPSTLNCNSHTKIKRSPEEAKINLRKQHCRSGQTPVAAMVTNQRPLTVSELLVTYYWMVLLLVSKCRIVLTLERPTPEGKTCKKNKININKYNTAHFICYLPCTLATL